MLENFDIFKDEDNNCYQIRSKTSTFVVVFDEEESEKIFLKIVEMSLSDRKVDLQIIRKELLNDFDEGKVLSVLNDLKEAGLIPDDTNNCIQAQPSSFRSIEDASIAIIGNSNLTKAFKQIGEIDRFKDVAIFEFEENDFEEKSLEIFKNHDFVIVDAQRWSPYHLEIINETAVKLNKPWLYISGINEDSIEIGPMFYGRETGCYNCLVARIKSNDEHPEYLTSYEKYLRDLKKPSSVVNMFHDGILYSIIANFAIYETIKFIEGWALPMTWQSIIKINTYNYDTSVHTLLKKPLCKVCKPEIKYNPAPWLDKVTLK